MTTDQIDRLYPAAPVPASGACPEAGLSLCLKGRLRGLDAQLTVRGATREEFLRNVLSVLDLSGHLDALTGLFEAPGGAQASRPVPSPEARPEGWCAIHGVQMIEQSNERGTWLSHYLGDRQWCRGKAKKPQN